MTGLRVGDGAPSEGHWLSSKKEQGILPCQPGGGHLDHLVLDMAQKEVMVVVVIVAVLLGFMWKPKI